MTRETLHNLVDRLPPTEMTPAARFLEFLCGGVDDEPLTAEDWESIREGEAASRGVIPPGWMSCSRRPAFLKGRQRVDRVACE